MKKWLSIVPILLLMLLFAIPTLAGDPVDPQQGAPGQRFNFYDAVGIEDRYTTSDTIEVHLPDSSAFPAQSADKYTVSLWKMGESDTFVESWKQVNAGEIVPVSLSGKTPGFYFIRLKSHQSGRDVVNDFYFQVVDSIPAANADPVLSLSSSTVQAGMLDLGVTVQAPGAENGFIIIGSDMRYFEGELGFDLFTFNDAETNIPVYATVFYPNGVVKSTNEQTLTVTKTEELGDFIVSAYPDALLPYGNDVHISYSPVTSPSNVPITYYARLYDVDQNWKPVRREMYVSQNNGDDSEVLMGASNRILFVDSSELEPGHLYNYSLIAEASGYGMQVYEGFFRTEDTSQTYMGGLSVSINGDSSGQPVTVEEHQPFGVHIDFPNNQNPDELHIYFNDVEAEYWNWGMTRQVWADNGCADFTWHMPNPVNTVCYVEAKYNNGDVYTASADIRFVPGQQQNFDKLIPATVTLDSEIVTQGTYITATVTGTDLNAQSTSAYVEDPDYQIYRGDYELMGDTIKIPTLNLQPGSYMLTVASYADDYEPAYTVKAFRVLPAATTPIAELTADYDHVQTHQQVVLSGYIKDADHVELHFLEGNNPDRWHDQRNSGGEYIEAQYGWGQSGTYHIQLVGYDQNNAVIETADISITVSSNGMTPDPVMTIPATIAEGEDLTGTFTAAGADWVHVNLNLQDEGGQGYGPQEQDIDIGQNDFNDGFTFADDIFHFTAGQVYRVEMNSNKVGEESGRAVAYVTVVKNVDTQKTVTLTANGQSNNLHILSGEYVHIEINAPGATAFRVWDGGHWQFEVGDSAEYDWRYGDDAVIIAMACYDNQNYENWNYDQWNNAAWTGVSNSIKVNVTSHGTLNAPHFQLSGLDAQNTLPWGSFLTATVTDAAITADNNTVVDGWYYANLEQMVTENGNSWWQWIDLRDNVNIHGSVIMIPTFQLEGNTRYRISVGADAIGWNGNFSIAEFFLGPKSANTDPYFSVFENNVQTKDPVIATAYYEGADWIEIKACKNGDPGWQDMRNNGGNMVSAHFDFGSAGTYTLTAVAHIMQKDQNGNVISGPNSDQQVPIGTAQTVTVTAPKGNLDPITLNDIPSLLIVGEGVNGSFNTVYNAEHYYVEAQYQPEDGNWPNPLIQRNMDVVPGQTIDTSIVIPASKLTTPGRYRIWVEASGAGYNESGIDRYFRVIEQPAQSDVVLKVNGKSDTASTVASANMDITVSAPGASAIRILNEFGEWQYWDSRAFDDQGVFHWDNSMNGGTYMMYAEASYDNYDWEQMDRNNGWMNFRWEDMNWSSGSNIVTVTVSTNGATAAAAIAQINDVDRGAMVPIAIESVGAVGSANRASWVYTWIENENGWDMSNGRGQGAAIDPSSNEYPTFIFPTGNLESGTYYACVNSSCEGYDTTTSKYAFTVVEPQGDTVIFEVQEEPLYADTEFHISAYAPGASWMEIVFEDTNGNTFSWDGFQGDFISLDQAQQGEGTYQIHAVAHYMNASGQETGTKESDIVTRMIRSLGRLDDLMIHAPSVYELGTNGSELSFTVDGLNQGDWYVSVVDPNNMIDVQDPNGGSHQEPFRVAEWSSDNWSSNQFLVPSQLLEAGRIYQIQANVNAPGYEGGNGWKQILAVNAADQDVVLSIAQNGSDLAHWPSSKNLHVTVSAPDSVKAVKFWDNGIWQYRDNIYGTDENGHFAIDMNYNDEGDYAIVAMATTDTPPQNVSMEEWEDLNWIKTSNQVAVHVEAIGQLPVPDNYSMASAFKLNQDIVITINNPVQDQWYGATLRRPDGWNVSNYIEMDETTNTITIPISSMLIESGQYVVSVWTDKEGVLGAEALVPIVIDNLTDVSVFTLPANLTTVEAEAFAGVPMDVVIVQGSNNTLDLSFLNETSTRYVVGEGLTIPAFSTFEVITPAQYDALK